MANEVTIKDFATVLAEFNQRLTDLGSLLKDRNGNGAYDYLIRISALAITDAYQTIEDALLLVSLDTSTDDWLDKKAEDVGTERQVATKTKKEFKLTRTSTVSSLNIAIDDIIKSPVIAQRGQLRWFTIEDEDTPGFAGVFEIGVSEITVTFEADEAGTEYNNMEELLGISEITMEIESGLSGVDTVKSTDEDLEPGTDTETDEQLRVRLKSRWAELATGSTKESYINFAKNSSAKVVGANVTDERINGPTGVQVVVAGPPGSAVLAVGINEETEDNFRPNYTSDGTSTGDPRALGNTVHDYIRERNPLTDILFVKSVVEQSQNIDVDLLIEDGFVVADVKAIVDTRISAFFTVQKTVTDVTPLEVGEDLLHSVLNAVIKNTDGVADVSFNTPAAGVNVSVDADKILTQGTITIGDI